jgi:hypothetical protein
LICHDDEVLVRMLISDILQDSGFKIIEVKDAGGSSRSGGPPY